MSKLKRYLYEEYNGFTDKRIKRLEKGSRFTVDDRSDSDFDARKQLYLWFCSMYVDVISEEQVNLKMIGGIPISLEVKEWLDDKNYELVEQIDNLTLEIPIAKGQQGNLNELADRIDRIIKRRYEVPAYKYVCPRTAGSLRRLEKTMSSVWNN